MKSYIALDVGGTSIAASVVSPDGRLLCLYRNIRLFQMEARKPL